jgi:hypothetical protein
MAERVRFVNNLRLPVEAINIVAKNVLGVCFTIGTNNSVTAPQIKVNTERVRFELTDPLLAGLPISSRMP